MHSAADLPLNMAFNITGGSPWILKLQMSCFICNIKCVSFQLLNLIHTTMFVLVHHRISMMLPAQLHHEPAKKKKSNKFNRGCSKTSLITVVDYLIIDYSPTLVCIINHSFNLKGCLKTHIIGLQLNIIANLKTLITEILNNNQQCLNNLQKKGDFSTQLNKLYYF